MQMLDQGVLSYGTCIKTTIEDPKQPGVTYTVGNMTVYSDTTLRHQEEHSVATCDIILHDVPLKATAHDLRTRALAVLMGLE